jgi:hypothetical protein
MKEETRADYPQGHEDFLESVALPMTEEVDPSE